MAAIKILFMVFVASVSTGLARFASESSRDGVALSVSKNICDNDCIQILEHFTFSRADSPDLMKNSLSALCQSLYEGEAKILCLKKLDKNIATAIILSPLLKPSQVCTVLSLCSTQSEMMEQEVLTNQIPEIELSSGVSVRGTNAEVQISPQCTFCLFVLRKLEEMLPKERTEEAVMKAMEEVCDLLPSSYKDQCDNFVDKYGKEVVEFLLSSAAPHAICAMLHLCLFQERPVVEETIPSDCDSCRTLAALTRIQLGSNASEAQTSTFLGSVCMQYPHAVPKCEIFIQRYGSKLQTVLGKGGSTLDNCGRVDLCVTVKKVELLGQNHCTWGNNYRCRDEKMAQECNSVEFCQKYVWK